MDTLESDIQRFAAQGFRVVVRTKTTAQLIRPKRFNLIAACAWLLVFGIGIVFYLFYFLAKSDDMVYLSTASDGSINRAGAQGYCSNCGHLQGAPRLTCKRCRTPLAVTP